MEERFTETQVKHLMKQCNVKMEMVVNGCLATITNVQWGEPGRNPRVPIRVVAEDFGKADTIVRDLLRRELATGRARLMSDRRHNDAIEAARTEESAA